MLGSVIYLARKPRVKVAFEEGPRVAELDAGGAAGLPQGPPLLPPRCPGLPVGRDPLRHVPRRARGHLPDVRPRPGRRRRHLHQLRPRPQGRADAPSRSAPASGRSPAAPRSPDACCRSLSSALFCVGTLLIAIGFAAFVGHAVMLANGRRTIPALVPASQPAYAGVVTGSFVSSQERAASGGPTTFASPSPLSQGRHRHHVRGLAGPRGVAAGARHRGRPRAVGQHVRVQRRVRVLDDRRLPVPPAALPDPLDRLHPDRRGARDAAVRVEPARPRSSRWCRRSRTRRC